MTPPPTVKSAALINMRQMTIDEVGQQAKQLRRVRSSIEPAIIEFLRGNREFRMEALRDFVHHRTPIAPGSTDRVLRDMRQRGIIDYRVTNRRASTYEVVSISSDAA